MPKRCIWGRAFLVFIVYYSLYFVVSLNYPTIEYWNIILMRWITFLSRMKKFTNAPGCLNCAKGKAKKSRHLHTSFSSKVKDRLGGVKKYGCITSLRLQKSCCVWQKTKDNFRKCQPTSSNGELTK